MSSINLGDVGYISDGKFEMLLSTPSALVRSGSNVKVHRGPGCFHTRNVKLIGFSDGEQNFTPLYVLFIIPLPTIFRNVSPRLNDAGDEFTFELSGSGDAALVARYPTTAIDLPKDSEKLFEKYLLDNFDALSQKAKDSSQNAKPVIVSGFDRTGNLAMMSYPPKNSPLHSRGPTTEPMFSKDPSFQGKWSFRSVPFREEHPSAGPDQRVFIRYFTIRKRWGALRLKGGAGTDSGGSEVEVDV